MCKRCDKAVEAHTTERPVNPIAQLLGIQAEMTPATPADRLVCDAVIRTSVATKKLSMAIQLYGSPEEVPEEVIADVETHLLEAAERIGSIRHNGKGGS